MLHPNDNAGEILERHEEKIEALEMLLRGLLRIILLGIGILSVSKALKK